MSFFQLMQVSLPLLLQGLELTLELAAISLLIAMFLGIVMSLFGMSHSVVLRAINRVYVAIIRGTPLLVQAYFIYFGVTGALGIRITAFTAGVIALSLNAGGYLSEIFRGGIQAVPMGQTEAARSLGLSRWQTTYKIILPQAVRICIPSVVNQCCITIKDTSIICVIGLAELTRMGQTIIARTYRSFEVWIMVGVLYFLVIWLLTVLSRHIEKKVSLG
ncbi:MAG: amino acid ABC transporter permease [Atopobiaceae bacterium]|jgi:His/Glu/Gln/Arg/opine family amino acid ABC transporter permease subunit|nr:amino acid ABC transporter permease [Atopobiaceae bacterium]MCH4119531.1 amino acid ABC transporter permease [Atopobiaceae bacterium]MCI1317909.1 amino acid ABC transporter permease [Atopobiaceae bacterium]MCI1389584.1 amino acid ABC transporter permease [Atopobiaceae bacterium]MCI1431648.1 amino acid ABC transporter permease [Atopobiaceae bacterium]